MGLRKTFLLYLKTKHNFHIVDPSPWPLTASFGAFISTSGLSLYMHRYHFNIGLLYIGIFIILYTMFVWWRDIVREATFEDKHTFVVRRGLRLGMFLFIISEVMFFFAFFWAFFHSSLAPTFNIGGVWPPKAITPINTFSYPLLNTCLLLTSGASVTWAHKAIVACCKRHTLVGLLVTLILAVIFLFVQQMEYLTAPFSISDGIYGSCFYMTTGFHGFHVLVGSIALLVAFCRVVLNHFTNEHHFGLEAAIWYWHFVDIVWLFVFGSIYWWGNL